MGMAGRVSCGTTYYARHFRQHRDPTSSGNRGQYSDRRIHHHRHATQEGHRARDRSFAASFFSGALADTVLELRDSAGALIASNDNWRSTQETEIIATTIPPSNDLESAIVATLPANGSAYTAIVRGANNGTGIGVVEAYDLDRAVDSKLANISTRGFVQTEDNVLIGGLIVLGQGSLERNRAGDRTFADLGIAGALGDPTLGPARRQWRTDRRQ